MVRSIGADHVIDYTKEDFTTGAERYDVVFDNVGNHSLSELRRVVHPEGKYIMIGGPSGRWIDPLPRAFSALVLSRFVSQDMGMFLSHLDKKDLTILQGLMEDGTVTPVIDRLYRLSEVADAIQYLETGHARAKVVITID
jgi:NADPH:quinone reductase-like Zn-dependent oxidoreductase